jgi:hypothetical protein
MSLTSQLGNPKSPYRTFVDQYLPELKQSWKFANITFSGLQVCPAPSESSGTWKPGIPIVMPQRSQAYPWATVGTSIDYRLRFRFVVPPATALIAYQGASAISDFLGDKHSRSEAIVEQIVQEINSFGDGAKVPPQNTQRESELARLCYALSLFDSAFRASSALRTDWPAVKCAVKGDLERLLLESTAEVIDDCAALASLAFQRFPFDLFPCKGVVNPTFAGSLSVGGADADMVINGLLIDLKTTSKAGTTGADVMQIVGYLMLDWNDSAQIDKVGIYYTRHGALASWGADELVHTASRGEYNVSTLRAVFKSEFSKYVPYTSGSSFNVHWGFDIPQ